MKEIIFSLLNNFHQFEASHPEFFQLLLDYPPPPPIIYPKFYLGVFMRKLFSILFALIVAVVPCLADTAPGAVLDFIVVDLYTKVSREDVVRAVKAVQKQTVRDFAPIWGTSANFTLLPRGEIPNITDNKKAIVYLIDEIIQNVDLFVGSVSNHYIVLPPPNEFDGPQPNFWVPSLPTIPDGTPVVILPFGSKKLNYGIEAVFTPFGQSVIPLKNVGDILSFALSHETMESLADTYAGYEFLYAYQILTPGPKKTNAYSREVCDPVTWGSFNFYKINKTTVINFVFPEFFNPAAGPDTQFDFLGNAKQPFTPFGGAQFGYTINSNGRFASKTYLAFPSDPTNLITVSFPIYRKCQSGVKKVKISALRHKGLPLPVQNKS